MCDKSNGGPFSVAAKDEPDMPNGPKTTITDQRIVTVCLLILAAAAIAAALYLIGSVLIPFILAVFLTYCLIPLVDAQIKWLRIPRPLAILTTIVLACAVLFFLGLLILTAVGQITVYGDEYRAQIKQFTTDLFSELPLEKLGLQIDPAQSVWETLSGAVTTLLAGTARGVMSLVSNGVLVLIFLIFMLAGRKTPPPVGSIRYEVETQVKRYLLAMVFTSGITGILVGATLNVLGVSFAWMFGFLAFLLNFIPNIGSVVATLLPIPVALLNPELSLTAKVLALAIPTAIQFTIGNIIQPKIMGQSLDLHPVAILLALMFFGTIWGIVGMFLATPIAAVLKILFQKLEYTRPIAKLLAGHIDDKPVS